jgi:hypothetical protein
MGRAHLPGDHRTGPADRRLDAVLLSYP